MATKGKKKDAKWLTRTLGGHRVQLRSAKAIKAALKAGESSDEVLTVDADAVEVSSDGAKYTTPECPYETYDDLEQLAQAVIQQRESEV